MSDQRYGGGGMISDTYVLPPPVEQPEFPFRYSEGEILAKLEAYLEGTYGEHYAKDTKSIQVIDMWDAVDIAPEACQSNVMKYISRYGRKGGHNKKDLLKAMHYTILLWHFTKDLD